MEESADASMLEGFRLNVAELKVSGARKISNPPVQNITSIALSIPIPLGIQASAEEVKYNAINRDIDNAAITAAAGGGGPGGAGGDVDAAVEAVAAGEFLMDCVNFSFLE